VRTEKGNILHETGKVLPVSTHDRDDGRAYAVQLAAALRHEMSSTRTAAKTVMRWTGASERTVKTWLAGTNAPSGEHLVALMRHSDAIFALVLRLSGRASVIGPNDIDAVRQHLLEALVALDEASTPQAGRTKIDRGRFPG
jgi:hypothetical protein